MLLRRPPHARGLALLLGLALLAPARARAAEPPRLTAFPAGSVAAGSTVELRWTRPAGAVEEIEILLSVDGGRSYPIRVSPSLEPGAAPWRWRVPNLPAAEARLRVRALVDGRETPGQPTPPFRIVGESGRPPERELIQEGGWWDGLAPAGRDAPPTLTPRTPVLLDAADAVAALAGAPPAPPAPPALAGVMLARARAARPARTPRTASVPARVPLRR